MPWPIAVALGMSALSLLVSCVTLAIVAGMIALPAQESVAVPRTQGDGEEGRHSVPAASISVEIDAVETRETTVAISFTVTQSGPQALLFDVPELDGQRPTPESLEMAQVAMLDTVARAQASASLEFPLPQGGGPWTLVFNPLHQAGHHVAPRVEVEVSP